MKALYLVGLLVVFFTCVSAIPQYCCHSNGFIKPLTLIYRNDSYFIGEQDGIIYRCNSAQPFECYEYLNIDAVVNSGANERGLLSFAFDPNFETNGHIYVFYTDSNGDLVVYRYLHNGWTIDDTTAKLVFGPIDHSTYGNHNGGTILFDPQGYLLISTGDGGDANDPFKAAQNVGSHLGKILRLDVSTLPGTAAADNPVRSGGQPEVFAVGLRNPWRMSIDPVTNWLWIGDVGQETLEEIDVLDLDDFGSTDLNFGWSCFEGTNVFNSSCGVTGPFLVPAHEYPHSAGNDCVIGGHVYRGSIAALAGIYLFSDNGGSIVYQLSHSAGTAYDVQSTASVSNFQTIGSSSTSFGYGENNESFFLRRNGNIYELVDVATCNSCAPRSLISAPTSGGVFFNETSSSSVIGSSSGVSDGDGSSGVSDGTDAGDGTDGTSSAHTFQYWCKDL